MKYIVFRALLCVLIAVCASCGGGTGGNTDGSDQVSSDSNASEDNTDEVEGEQTSSSSGFECPIAGTGFGGDIAGNEYMETGPETTLLLGDSIGANMESNADLVTKIDVRSCTTDNRLELGAGYILSRSHRATGFVDILIEVKNVSREFVCGTNINAVLFDAEGRRLDAEMYGGESLGLNSDVEGQLVGRKGTRLASEGEEMTYTCLRSGEIGYYVHRVRGSNAFRTFLTRETVRSVAVKSFTVDEEEWSEELTILPQVVGYEVFENAEVEGSTTRSGQLDLLIEGVDSIEILQQLIDQGAFNGWRVFFLDSIGRPVYYTSGGTAGIGFFFTGSITSIRVIDYFGNFAFLP